MSSAGGGTTSSFWSTMTSLPSLYSAALLFASVTVTLPSSSTVKVMSVTATYPFGAASSWNVYVPAGTVISWLSPSTDVQASTVSPASFLMTICAPPISLPSTSCLEMETVCSCGITGSFEKKLLTFTLLTVFFFTSILPLSVISVLLSYPSTSVFTCSTE